MYSLNNREGNETQYNQLLQKAELEYLTLVRIINEKLATLPKGSDVFKRLQEGIQKNDVTIQYGDRHGATGGNMEGSLYSDFEGHTLRIRRAGDNGIYLDNTGNYFKASGGFGEKHLIPRIIDGEEITDINEQGVTVIDHMLIQENHEMKNNRHKTVGRDIEAQRKKVGYKIKQLFSTQKEKSIFELEPQGLTRDEMKKVINIDMLNRNLDLVIKGLQKTVVILEEELNTSNN